MAKDNNYRKVNTFISLASVRVRLIQNHLRAFKCSFRKRAVGRRLVTESLPFVQTAVSERPEFLWPVYRPVIDRGVRSTFVTRGRKKFFQKTL